MDSQENLTLSFSFDDDLFFIDVALRYLDKDPKIRYAVTDNGKEYFELQNDIRNLFVKLLILTHHFLQTDPSSVDGIHQTFDSMLSGLKLNKHIDYKDLLKPE